MTDQTAAVIIPTTGRASLRRAVESVIAQTHEATVAVVVVDGPQFGQAVLETLDGLLPNPRVQLLPLPQNTGANGFTGHRIYGSVPFLVNSDWIAFLDDDNWYEPEHIAECLDACESCNLDWCFTLRNIWHDGKLVCPDHCESVGLWPTWNNPEQRHIDTNCFFMRRKMAVSVGAYWYRSRYDHDGSILESADTVVASVLMSEEPRHALIARPTVNYVLGSWELSPKLEFFVRGNEEFLKRHGGVLPWEASGDSA